MTTTFELFDVAEYRNQIALLTNAFPNHEIEYKLQIGQTTRAIDEMAVMILDIFGNTPDFSLVEPKIVNKTRVVSKYQSGNVKFSLTESPDGRRVIKHKGDKNIKRGVMIRPEIKIIISPEEEPLAIARGEFGIDEHIEHNGSYTRKKRTVVIKSLTGRMYTVNVDGSSIDELENGLSCEPLQQLEIEYKGRIPDVPDQASIDEDIEDIVDEIVQISMIVQEAFGKETILLRPTKLTKRKWLKRAKEPQP